MNFELWARLKDYAPGPTEVDLGFSQRLARENQWTANYSQRVLEEYRRFAYLAIAAGHSVTPSDQVDQAWHLHLQYSRDYWERFCAQALQSPLHHGPTQGGDAEERRYGEAYALTLKSYVAHFEEQPPADIWPPSVERFREPARFVRLDAERYWIVRRPSIRTAAQLAVCALLSAIAPLAHALPANPMDWTAQPFLTLQVLLLIGSVLAASNWRRRLRDIGEIRGQAAQTPAELAYLAGGEARALDASVTKLLSDGDLSIENGHLIAKKFPFTTLAEPERSILLATRTPTRPSALIKRGSRYVSEVRESLVRTGLALNPDQITRARWWPAVVPALVTLFGCSKIAVGLGRERPVGFMIVLSVIGTVITLSYLLTPIRNSRAGDKLLADMQRRHKVLKRAVSHGDLALGVALFGTGVLVATPLAAYNLERRPANDSGTSDSSSSDSSSDSSGSGCGGCGGGGGD